MKDGDQRGETGPVHRKDGSAAVILFADDDPLVRALVVAILKPLGYTVLAAEGGAHALELAANHPGPIDLLLTDVMMPGMNGRELAERLNAARPGLRVLYISGYTAEVLAQPEAKAIRSSFLAKPFTAHMLERKLRELLGR